MNTTSAAAIRSFPVLCNTAAHFLNDGTTDSLITAAMYAGMALYISDTEAEVQQVGDMISKIVEAAHN